MHVLHEQLARALAADRLREAEQERLRAVCRRHRRDVRRVRRAEVSLRHAEVSVGRARARLAAGS